MREIRVDAVANVVREVVSQEAMRGREVTHHSIPAFDETGGPIREMGDGIGSAKTQVTGGEVLISKLNPRKPRVLIVGTVARDELAVCSGEFVVLRPRAISPRYLRYALLSDRFRQRLEACVQSVTRSQQRVSPDDIAHAWIEAPDSCGEQEQIADHLDAEIARLDALIAAREQQSSLLSERARSVASALCLGGERPDARTQPSGIAPVGDIPEHWRTLRNKVFLREMADLSEDGSEDLLTVSHLTGVTTRAEKAEVTMFKATSTVGYKRCAPGDLVINTMWAWMGALGVARQHGIVSPAYGVYRFDHDIADPAYFEHVFRSPAYVAEMTRYSKGVWTSRLRLYPDAFLALRSPVPALSEQQSIVAAILGQVSRDVALRDELRRSITLLRERRQALITAAVTGKLDVG